MIIKAHHRSARLAERHLRALRREHSRATVEIISRRNARGGYSKYGHIFFFEVTELQEKIELVLHFDYSGGKDRERIIRFQFHILGPGDVTDVEALQTVRDFERTGKLPKGWKSKSITWGAGRSPDGDENEFNLDEEREQYLKKLVIYGGEGQVTGRNPVRKNRRTGRKAKSK